MDDRNRAFLEATLPHLDVVYRVARNVSRDPENANDLVQETYLRALLAFSREEVRNPKSWLVTICLNLARSDARRRARRFTEAPLTEDVEPRELAGGVLEQVLATIEREQIAHALQRLPEEQRVAITLMDLAAMSASEVAAVLGCPRNTVLSRVHRGRKLLARYLIEEQVDRDLF